MAITRFIPEVWSATLLQVLLKSLVYGGGNVVNRNYEGDIAAYGDTVHITSIADPTIVDYTKDTDLTAAEALTDTEQLLVITQSKAFNFAVDDIDMRQSRSGGALMAEAAFRSGFKLRDTADQFIAGLMKAGAQDASNLGSLSVATTATDAYDKVLVPLSEKLDEANVPEEGRFVVVPPAFYSKLLLDSRFIKVNESGSQMGLRNGNVGNALGFTVLKSNNAPTAFRTVTDGDTTSGSKTVTSATAAFTKTDVGAPITGTGIAAATTIASVESATSITLSANATATGTGISLTIGTTGSKVIIAGSNIATTYAEQINKVEAYRPQARFADALKGLHLYGAKVVRPEALAVASVATS
jgi:hypothetical protein